MCAAGGVREHILNQLKSKNNCLPSPRVEVELILYCHALKGCMSFIHFSVPKSFILFTLTKLTRHFVTHGSLMWYSPSEYSPLSQPACHSYLGFISYSGNILTAPHCVDIKIGLPETVCSCLCLSLPFLRPPPLHLTCICISISYQDPPSVFCSMPLVFRVSPRSAVSQVLTLRIRWCRRADSALFLPAHLQSKWCNLVSTQQLSSEVN